MSLPLGRATRGGLVWLAWAAACLATSAEEPAKETIPPLLPVEDFARAPRYDDLQISPDGAHLSFEVTNDNATTLGILDLSDMKERLLSSSGAKLGVNGVLEHQWVGAERIIAETRWGLLATDPTFSAASFLSGSGRQSRFSEGTIHFDENRFDVAGMVRPSGSDPAKVFVLHFPDWSNLEIRPDVYAIDTNRGGHRLAEKNPGNVRSWGADWDGNIRFGLISAGSNKFLIVRDAPGKPWSKPIEFGRGVTEYELLATDEDPQLLYILKPSANGRQALFRYDLRSREFGAPLFQHEKYDIAAAVFSPKHRRLLGVRYFADGPRQYWFEPDFARLQKLMEQATPGLVHMIVSMDRDLTKLLFYSYSSRDPGYYSLVDIAANKTVPIARARPWLNAAHMAEMHPVHCEARDGVELNGYLTLPVGRGQQKLPMVTLVHGGPYGVRDVWAFDPVVQFLANRGYAVLQVNFRGSGGYGEDFYLKGSHEVGGAMQHDIEDMTRWAVKVGVADPERLAIAGASFGGYSTLFALADSPELFRCGVAMMAVTDWPSLFKQWDEQHLYVNDALRFWASLYGDLRDPREKARLASVSPIRMADRIAAPLLLIHGTADTQVPIVQAQTMEKALKRAGHPPEVLYMERVGHWLPADKQGTEMLQRIEAFLARNLAAPPETTGKTSGTTK